MIGFWTDNTINDLKLYNEEWLSASQIGKRLHCSRSAVLGKLMRLKVKLKSGNHTKSVQMTNRFKSEPRLPSTYAREVEVPKDEPKSLRVSLTDIGPNQCRWIALDPLVDPSMCGHPANGSLCPHHRSRAFQPLKPQKESA